MGRLKKEDSVKPGHLQKGLMRFSFIAKEEVISSIKQLSKKEGVSIKDFMDNILSQYIEYRTPKNKNEELLSQFNKQKNRKSIFKY
jgi:hypothetical protein